MSHLLMIRSDLTVQDTDEFDDHPEDCLIIDIDRDPPLGLPMDYYVAIANFTHGMPNYH